MLAYLQTVDHALLRWLHAGDAPPWLVLAIVSVTFLGSGWVLLALLPTFAFASLRARVTWLLGAVLGTSFIVWAVKELIGRARPCHVHPWAYAVHVAAPAGPSFPSGHSAGSFAFAAFVFTLERRWGMLALSLASMVAASRVALGVHYPSDVMAGAILGMTIGGLCGHLSQRLDSRPRIRRSPGGVPPSLLGTCLQDTPSRPGSHDRA